MGAARMPGQGCLRTSWVPFLCSSVPVQPIPQTSVSASRYNGGKIRLRTCPGPDFSSALKEIVGELRAEEKDN